MSKVTADTITDEQIRELRDSAEPLSDVARDCNWSLASYVFSATKRAARARCAEIWNALLTRDGGPNE